MAETSSTKDCKAKAQSWWVYYIGEKAESWSKPKYSSNNRKQSLYFIFENERQAHLLRTTPQEQGKEPRSESNSRAQTEGNHCAVAIIPRGRLYALLQRRKPQTELSIQCTISQHKQPIRNVRFLDSKPVNDCQEQQGEHESSAYQQI